VAGAIGGTIPALRRRRQSAGLEPTMAWNMRVRWLWSAKPQLEAMTLMLSSVRSSISPARRTRCRSSQRCGGVPMLALNALAK